jgi:hypothetical protein
VHEERGRSHIGLLGCGEADGRECFDAMSAAAAATFASRPQCLRREYLPVEDAIGDESEWGSNAKLTMISYSFYDLQLERSTNTDQTNISRTS